MKQWKLNLHTPHLAPAKFKQNQADLEMDEQYAILWHLACITHTWPAILDSFNTRIEKLEKLVFLLYIAAQILNWWRK